MDRVQRLARLMVAVFAMLGTFGFADPGTCTGGATCAGTDAEDGPPACELFVRPDDSAIESADESSGLAVLPCPREE